MSVQSVIDIDQTLSQFGLKSGMESEQDAQDTADDQEIEDAISEDQQDSLEAEADSLEAGEEYDDQDEDYQDEESFDDSGDQDTGSQKLNDANKKIKELEDRLSSDQDVTKQQLQQLYAEFQNLKQESQVPAEDFDLGEDEDYVEAGKVKGYVDSQLRKSQEQAQLNEMYVKNTYLNAQPDLSDVNAYITEKQLMGENGYSSMPTDDVGRYFAVKNRMLTDKIKDLENKHKREVQKVKKNRKPKVPPTGGKSRRSVQSGKFTRQEQHFMQLGNKLGIDLTPK